MTSTYFSVGHFFVFSFLTIKPHPALTLYQIVYIMSDIDYAVPLLNLSAVF